MRPDVSVILIRENAEQLTGSGCCGKLEGDAGPIRSGEAFAHTRADQQRCGQLHRAVRQLFPSDIGQPQVSVVTVDPRNQLYLAAKLCRDVCRYRPGVRAGLRSLLQAFSLPAVVVNGRIISRRGTSHSLDDVVGEIQRQLRVRSDAPQPQG